MRIYDEEDQNVEFKESWNNTELLKWVCGFANAKGGRMYIGVRDDGKFLVYPIARNLWRISRMLLSVLSGCMMPRSISSEMVRRST